MNPKMTLAMGRAVKKVLAGMPVHKAAAQESVWPQSIYAALKREGLPLPRSKNKGGAK